MNFSEIFKNSFLANFASADITWKTVVMAEGMCCLFALYLFVVYRLVTRKTFYDKNMNISMAVICIIICGIIMTIQSNLVVSLGMVGALSIVRFRTAIKNPMDLVFLFWSIAIGIICGAGMTPVAAILSVAVTGGILIFNMLPVAKAPMLLVVNASSASAKHDVLTAVKNGTSSYTIKSQTIEKERLSMIIEVAVKNEDVLMNGISGIEAVTRASLLSHDGEVTF